MMERGENTIHVSNVGDDRTYQYLALSAAATARSKTPLVGLPVRLYSYPDPKLFGSSLAVGMPGVDCRKVVARLIGGTTAPVGFAIVVVDVDVVAEDESSPTSALWDDGDDDDRGSSMWR